VTDNESAKIKGPHGVIQGYTGIAAADAKAQVIVSAEAHGTDYEGGVFPDVLDNLQNTMKEITGKEAPLKEAVVLADTNYSSEMNLQAAAERGIEVLIPDTQFRVRDERFAGRRAPKKGKRFVLEDFKYDKKDDTYICLGRVHTTQSDTNTGQEDKGGKHSVQLLISREHIPQPLLPTEQPLHIVPPSVQLRMVRPRTHSIPLRRYYRLTSQLPRRQSGSVILRGTVHQQRDGPFQRYNGFQQQPPGLRVRDIPGGQAERLHPPLSRCRRGYLRIPTPAGRPYRLRAVFFLAPCASGGTLTAVASSEYTWPPASPSAASAAYTRSRTPFCDHRSSRP
jgi:hypothetical protein